MQSYSEEQELQEKAASSADVGGGAGNIYICIYTHTPQHMSMCVYTYPNLYVCARTHTYMYTYTYANTHTPNS